MWRSLVGCFCSSSTGASIGEISRSKRPSSQARLARGCDSNPNASMSSRVMPRRLAIRSAASNWLGRSMSHDSARQLRSGPALAPRPTRLIASIPHAMPTSIAPAAIRPAIRWLACCPLPHWQSTVVAPTCSGRPAVSHAVRLMLLDCSPYCVTQPPMSCSTSPASMPAFSTTAFCTAPSSSVACSPDSHPLRLPIGLRVASTITGLPMGSG